LSGKLYLEVTGLSGDLASPLLRNDLLGVLPADLLAPSRARADTVIVCHFMMEPAGHYTLQATSPDTNVFGLVAGPSSVKSSILTHVAYRTACTVSILDSPTGKLRHRRTFVTDPPTQLLVNRRGNEVTPSVRTIMMSAAKVTKHLTDLVDRHRTRENPQP
jgi:hypothetical protein